MGLSQKRKNKFAGKTKRREVLIYKIVNLIAIPSSRQIFFTL
jgi:hypothetical protein